MAETKTKTKKKEEESEELSLDEQLDILDPVALAVDRKFTNPDTGEEVTFIQKEMGFLTKTKFTRLLAGTLRLANQDDKQSVLDELAGASAGDSSYMPFILKAIELAPEFLEESFVLMLRVPIEDQAWFIKALDEVDDDYAVDIIDTFVAQNGKALRDFFTKHIKKLQARVQNEVNLNLGEEEDTA